MLFKSYVSHAAHAGSQSSPSTKPPSHYVPNAAEIGTDAFTSSITFDDDLSRLFTCREKIINALGWKDPSAGFKLDVLLKKLSLSVITSLLFV